MVWEGGEKFALQSWDFQLSQSHRAAPWAAMFYHSPRLTKALRVGLVDGNYAEVHRRVFT